jgi:hypothetical protein
MRDAVEGHIATGSGLAETGRNCAAEGRLKCRGGSIALLNLLLSAPSHNVGLGVLEGGIT